MNWGRLQLGARPFKTLSILGIMNLKGVVP